MNKKQRFEKICNDIKNIKIQGATNVAKAALKAYYLFPEEKSKKILSTLRPTEPMLFHVIELAGKKSKSEILNHFTDSQDKINKEIVRLLNNKKVIFTHCHSTNVIKALIYAKKHGKKFEVYNTETRPLFQGRKTAKELSNAGIKVTTFVDSAADIAMKGDKERKKVDLVLFGADALLKDAVINKVGSGMFSEIAGDNNIPVFIVADSWKYSPKNIKLEQRDFHEVWGTKKVHIKNPAFEPIEISNITGIISELGTMSYKKFLKIVSKR
jgi:translation initiation factor 2B subunit (eIF-2B alpha/beta/delta family)